MRGMVCICLATVALAAAADANASTEVIGTSVQGRPLHAWRVGAADARTTILVVGTLRGDERAGRAVTRRLRSVRAPRGVALWLIDDANPDGSAAQTAANANGVELERNFPERWQAGDGAGAAPLSEPESQALAAFIARVKPRVAIWYREGAGIVAAGGGDAKLERLYARRSRARRRTAKAAAGSPVAWLQAQRPDDSTFAVTLARDEARPHARAVRALARAIAPPRIVDRPIPFGRERKRQMRAYAERHYDISDYRLRDPKVIVQHYTVTDTFEPVYNHFATNVPDPELGELPQVCSHFVVDRDGAIYRLVSTRIMCRHTVGLNYTAIGIEHVGRSDGQVLGNARQMRASLRLTRWLQGRYGIATRNVIGHNENLSSPYHRERVARLRTQTHGDFPSGPMSQYRRRLGRLPAPASVR